MSTVPIAFGVYASLAASLALATDATPHTLVFVRTPAEASEPVRSDIARSLLAGRYLVGMQIVRADPRDVPATLHVLTEGFNCATDPVFSHDGARLAFSGKRSPSDPLQIWEITGQDSKPRAIVTCDADCVSPVYMPNGHIVFASTLSGEYEEHGDAYSLSLYDLAPGSDTPTRLTFNPSSDFDPVVLRDGRILYSSWQHVGNHHWPRGTIALMLINSDGTGVFPLTGNHTGAWLKRQAVPLDRDRIAFVQADRFHGFGGGELVVTHLNDPFGPYETLVAEDEYIVCDAAPGLDGDVLLAAKPATGSAKTFGLYARRNGAMRLIHDDPRYHEIAPVLGVPTVRAELRVSTVVPDTPYGYVVVLNCYDTDRPHGKALRDGAVKAARVIEGRPLRHRGKKGPTFFEMPDRPDEPAVHPSSATGYVPSRILGEVPLAADGSVYFKVPADRPLRIQLIDHQGFSIANERAWFWVRPNERRVCIGCHENRELAPHNRAPLAGKYMAVDLTDESRTQSITFREDIQPILAANCAITDCHIPPTPTAGMNLTIDRPNGNAEAALVERFGPAYANLLMRQDNKPFAIGGRRVHPGDALHSPLLWMLYGRALAPQYAPVPFERPMISAHPGPVLPEPLLDLIRKWVDLGATYDDESPPGPWPYQTVPADSVEASN